MALNQRSSHMTQSTHEIFSRDETVFYHDSAAALVEDGRILAAAQEERFTRKKHDPSPRVDSARSR
jgi:hypothetical protein